MDDYVCEECGDDLAADGLRYCTGCLDSVPELSDLPHEEVLRPSP